MSDRDATKQQQGEPRNPGRRRVLTGMAAGAGALALSGCGGDNGSSPYTPPPLPNPKNSGIEHFVVLMMENRSFDHFMGSWLPGADGLKPDREYPDRQGNLHKPFHLTDPQNCASLDPGHDMLSGRQQFNGGKLDGFINEIRNRDDDLFPIGYYEAEDLSFLGQAAPAWTSFDRYFAAAMMETYPNRFFMHAAQTDRLTNYLTASTFSTLPTIWDRLQDQGISRGYYYGNQPFVALWGGEYLGFSHKLDQFLEDAQSGNLPQVSFVDPFFHSGKMGNSDHPLADIRSGEYFMNLVYEAITQSPNWRNTVFVINYDEWGGFFDHVAPPIRPVPEAVKKTTKTPPPAGEPDYRNLVDGRLGFRVPALLVSPFARRGYVSHMEFDHTSVLKMIEWRFGLKPLSVRDRTANNLAHALDFDTPRSLQAPEFQVPKGPHKYGMFARTCSTSNLKIEENDFEKLYYPAKRAGFKVEETLVPRPPESVDK